MIQIAESHYNNLVELIGSLHRNFNLLLNEREKFEFNKIYEQFMKSNDMLKTSLQKTKQHYKILLIQFEDQNLILKQKTQQQVQQLRKKQEEISKLRIELTKNDKETLRLKQILKSSKQQLHTKSRELQEIQLNCKTQIKAIKKQYKDENKLLKTRIQELELLLQTAIVDNSSKHIEEQLDKELQELRNFQLSGQ